MPTEKLVAKKLQSLQLPASVLWMQSTSRDLDPEGLRPLDIPRARRFIKS